MMRSAAVRRLIEDYVYEMAELYGLQDWEINLSEELPSSESLASIFPTEGRKIATLRICPEFETYTKDRQREIIVHELTHLHWGQTWNYCQKAMSADQYEAFINMAEYAVDGIARAIACDFPLPHWGRA